jgi:hypothetical protein
LYIIEHLSKENLYSELHFAFGSGVFAITSARLIWGGAVRISPFGNSGVRYYSTRDQASRKGREERKETRLFAAISCTTSGVEFLPGLQDAEQHPIS